jgi:hypothetical protein
MVITGTSPFAGFQINTDENSHEITLDNVKPVDIGGRIDLEFNSSMSIKLKGENRLTSINCGGAVTIDDAGGGNGTLIAIIDDNPLYGNFTINSGTVKAKATMNSSALTGNLTVNGGAVYLAGGGGERAVQGVINSTVTLYGRNGSLWLPGWYDTQYVTTDDSSGDPTSWTW